MLKDKTCAFLCSSLHLVVLVSVLIQLMSRVSGLFLSEHGASGE